MPESEDELSSSSEEMDFEVVILFIGGSQACFVNHRKEGEGLIHC